MIAAAAVLFVASVAIYVGVAWWRKGQADLDRHIAEALDVANTPDYDANVAARWIG